MLSSLRAGCIVLVICCIAIGLGPSAQAQVPLTPGAAIGIVVIFAVMGAGVGTGLYYLARTPVVTGCAVSGAEGMTLTSESNQRVYLLAGETSLVKSGERVRIAGHKKKSKVKNGHPSFLIEKLKKDYGPCPGSSLVATP